MSRADPQSWRTRPARKYWRRWLVGTACSILAVLAASLGLHGRIVSRQLDNARLAASLSRLEVSQREMRALQSRAMRVERERQWQAQRLWPARWMRDLAATIPDETRLTAWQAHDGRLEVDGRTLGAEALASYLERMRRVTWWGPVALLGGALRQGDDTMPYAFRLRIGPPIGAADACGKENEL